MFTNQQAAYRVAQWNYRRELSVDDSVAAQYAQATIEQALEDWQQFEDEYLSECTDDIDAIHMLSMAAIRKLKS